MDHVYEPVKPNQELKRNFKLITINSNNAESCTGTH